VIKTVAAMTKVFSFSFHKGKRKRIKGFLFLFMKIAGGIGALQLKLIFSALRQIAGW